MGVWKSRGLAFFLSHFPWDLLGASAGPALRWAVQVREPVPVWERVYSHSGWARQEQNVLSTREPDQAETSSELNRLMLKAILQRQATPQMLVG